MNLEIKEFNELDYSKGESITSHIIKRVEDGMIITELRDGFDQGIISLRGKLIHPKTVTEPIYDNIDLFINNRSIVQKDSRLGLIDENNQVIIPLIYDLLKSINDDFYGGIIRNEGIFRVFNRDGRLCFEVKDKHIYNFDSFSSSVDNTLIAPYGNGKYHGVMDLKGNYLIKKKYLDIILLGDKSLLVQDRFGYYKEVDYHGNIKKSFDFKFRVLSGILESGLINIGYKYDEYLLNLNGKLSLAFGFISRFKNRMACARKKNTNQYCLITDEGNIIADQLYDRACSIGNVWHVEVKEGKYELYDKNGFIKAVNYNVEFEYDDCLMYIIQKNKLYGLVDTNGEIIIEPTYSDYNRTGTEFVLFRQNNDLVLIRYDGKCLKTFYNCNYDDIRLDLEKDFIIYKLHDEVTGVIDKNGQDILPPISLNSIQIVNEHYIIVDNYLCEINNLNIQFKLSCSLDDDDQQKHEFSFSSKKERDLFQLNCFNYMFENYTKQDCNKVKKIAKKGETYEYPN